MPISIELLAPAKNLSVGRAAVDCGADAVYIGAPQFGARQAAGNSLEDIAALVQYAHLFGVKVWVTLNTLLTETERAEAVRLAWQLYDIQVDGLIIQDLRLLQEALPPIRLHASTQCDNRTVEHIQQLEQYGFKRVVLARELSLEQIKAIRQATQIELEAFVHGALCVCYSGRCYLSERVVGRSANRGCCAQLCREKYDLLDKDGNEILHQKHLLSLHDMNRVNHLRELLEAGVTSFKIEGRLKDEDYVRNVVATYRKALDDIFAEPNSPYQRASWGRVELGFEPNIEKTFHRGGIDYFLHFRTANMANFDTPKSTGEYIGKTSPNPSKGGELLKIVSDAELHNGDGLAVGDEGFSIAVVGKDAQGWLVRPNKRLQLPANASVYRNYDKAYLDALHTAKTTRRLPLSLKLTETANGFQLEGKTIFHSSLFTFHLEKQPAQKPEQAVQNIQNQLSKLGDTPFYAAQVEVETNCFLPASIVNQWRREMVVGLIHNSQFIIHNCHSGHEMRSLIEHSALCIMNYELPEALMTTKYCLLYELGICRKQRRINQPEPHFLRRNTNQIFRLHFDCEHCEMQILPL